MEDSFLLKKNVCAWSTDIFYLKTVKIYVHSVIAVLPQAAESEKPDFPVFRASSAGSAM
mgnify:CR=1 FL=1